jgi:hypothetical protein
VAIRNAPRKTAPHDSHCAKEKESSAKIAEDFLFFGKKMKI